VNELQEADDQMPAGDANTSLDSALDNYGRLMRALHLTRARRGVPWAEFHVTLPQLRALSLLAAREQGVSGRELASLLGVGPSAVTPLIDRLVEQGLVRREEDRVDRRITRLLVTAAGLTVLERMVAGQRELMREVLSHLGPDELETVNRAFTLLYAGVRRAAAEFATTPIVRAC
jgi:DNA-binding MarR family transcriptional regulator